MNTEVNTPIERYQIAEELGLCPECGAEMVEIDRLKDEDYFFIWLRCNENGCSGSWLQKKHHSEIKQIEH